jgi:integrase
MRKIAHPVLAFEQWPAADRDAWAASIRPRGFLRPGGRGAAWRPASRRAALGAYGRWLAWLLAQGVDLAAEVPAGRFTAERAEDYARFLMAGRSLVTLASYFGILCMAVIALFPGEDWDWLRRMQKRLHRQAKPIREKPFAAAEDLYRLGITLLEQAGLVLDQPRDRAASPKEIRAAARTYRDGLIIAILASRPLRIKNLVAIEIGRHLRQTPTRTTIAFTAEETKTHAAISVSWPEALLPALTRYLAEVRPLLIAAPLTGGNQRRPDEPGARLWVGQGGTVLSPGGLNLALQRHTRRSLGQALTAHRFRDSVATSVANEDPVMTRFAAQILGHKGVTTTERHYITRDNATAFDRYHDILQALRRPPNRER